MAKFNATDLILKVNGTPIAHSTSATLNINQDLPDATSKDSAGWSENIRGKLQKQQKKWQVDLVA